MTAPKDLLPTLSERVDIKVAFQVDCTHVDEVNMNTSDATYLITHNKVELALT